MNIKFFKAFLLLFTCFFTLCSPVIAQEIETSDVIAVEGEDFMAEDTFAGEEDFDSWETEQPAEVVNDPARKVNRFIFKFNDILITRIFSPLSKVYDAVIPKPAQKCVSNLFSNLKEPKRFFNNAFQLKGKDASITLGRFLINSTVGLGGFFDPAKAAFRLEKQDEDFGQTLGHYGLEEGFYFMLPILGPTTGRDILGYVGDAAFNPLSWMSWTDVDPEDAWTTARYVRRVNNFSYNVRDNYKRITKNAFDSYSALQHAYIQNRRKKIAE